MRRHAAAVVHGSIVLLVSPDGALQAFDLATDPSQQRPLSVTDLVGGPGLGGGLAALPPAPGPGFTVAAAERLHALGYAVP
jgi:hypothetical protein